MLRLSVVFLIVILLVLGGLVLQVVALVDATRRSEAELAASGGKTLWIVLLAACFVVPGGLVLALIYLLAIRHRTSAVAAAP